MQATKTGEHFVTIRAHGARRHLFSIQQRASGDLTLVLKPGINHTSFGSFNADARFNELRYSIHRSLNSPTEINVIKLTTAFSDGRKITSGHYTGAIKRTRKFAPIFAYRSPHLGEPRYKWQQQRGEVVSLGEYEPNAFQLIYAIFVAPHDRTFDLSIKPNLIQISFKHFSIVIMWTFVGMPSNSTGNFFSSYTHRPETLATLPDGKKRSILTELADGIDEEKCVRFFQAEINSLLDLQEKWIANDNPNIDPGILNDFRILRRIFDIGLTSSKEFQDFWAAVYPRLSVGPNDRPLKR